MTNKTKKLWIKIMQAGNRAVRQAQEENRRLGIANVYSINGQMVYELNGKISTKPPKGY